MICKICQKESKSKRAFSIHLRKSHDWSYQEYCESVGLPDPIRRCKKCKKELSKNCGGEFCNHCRDRTGKNNSFFGKVHTKESIENTKIKLSKISKEKWKDKEYREKVIKGTSKPRRKGFGEEQGARVKEWYRQNPNQRKSRSKRMKKSWEDGSIVPSKKVFQNRSSAEKEMFAFLSDHFEVSRDSIKFDNGKWALPDTILVNKNIIIEYNGDFWHANPSNYLATETIHDGILAQEIWERDELRANALFHEGYFVIVLWEKEYKENKELAFKNLLWKIDELSHC